jgi:AcrR family transcriptional regulator
MAEALEAIDPRIVRTRRDVVDATTELLMSAGWGAVNHAEVARRSGYAKATIYAHWPTQLDLVRASIDQICGDAHHPPVTGDLRGDLSSALSDFANDLSDGHLDRVLAGVVERAGNEVVDELRGRLYAAGTTPMRSVLETHLTAPDVEPSLALLTGAVFVRVTFEGGVADAAFIDDLLDRVIGAATLH